MKYLIYCIPLLLLTGCKAGGTTYDLHASLALCIILAIIALFFSLAIYSNMLRDEVNDCDAFESMARKIPARRGTLRVKTTKPYSLSKVQFAVWTVIIACSFIYLALRRGNCADAPISQTALILMGIGAGVTTASALIDKREIQQGMARHQNAPSEGFFTDILSDKDGISLHRFQNVVWTGIAMVIYLSAVYGIKSGCALPELSQTLLILTGISSTTYVVLKANENSTPAVTSEQGQSAVQDPSLLTTETLAAPPAAPPTTVAKPGNEL